MKTVHDAEIDHVNDLGDISQALGAPVSLPVSEIIKRAIALREFVAWATPDEAALDHDEDGWECIRCAATVSLIEGAEQPNHGMCHACCSDVVEELFARAAALTIERKT